MEMSLLDELKEKLRDVEHYIDGRRAQISTHCAAVEALMAERADLEIAIAALSPLPGGGGLGLPAHQQQEPSVQESIQQEDKAEETEQRYIAQDGSQFVLRDGYWVRLDSQGSSESLDTTLPEAVERAEQAGADPPAPAAQAPASHEDEHTEARTPYQEGRAAWEASLNYDDNPYADIDDDRRLGWATGWVKRNAQSPVPKGADRIAHWGPFATTADIMIEGGKTQEEAETIERGLNAILRRSGIGIIADSPSDSGNPAGEDGRDVLRIETRNPELEPLP